ncbi:MAG: hypothetical protein ACU85E_16190 [Gammaproteobacteria bacterium]
MNAIAEVFTIAQGASFVGPELAQKLAGSMTAEENEGDKIKQLSPREASGRKALFEL